MRIAEDAGRRLIANAINTLLPTHLLVAKAQLTEGVHSETKWRV